MVLSNREKQARWRERMRDAAQKAKSKTRLARSYRGRYVVLPMKSFTAFLVRFEPTGYGPSFDVPDFPSEEAAERWIKGRRADANARVVEAVAKLAQGKANSRLTLMEAHKLLERVMPSDLLEGERQDLLGEALQLLRGLSAGPEPFADSTPDEYDRILRLVTLTLSEGL